MAKRFIPFILTLVLINACGTTAVVPTKPVSTTQSGASAPTQPLATLAPNPLNVQVSPDEPLAVSALIPAAGGSLSATSADGTLFTLLFPAGALLADETITLTPLSGVEGLYFSGGLVGGVQMAPEGLLLSQPATLTIESPRNVAAPGFETIAFAYHENGQGLYLNPASIEGNILTLEIWHFSGAGAAQATPVEIQNQQQRIPSNAEDAFTQRVQEYLGRQRQAQLLGQDTDPEFERRMGGFLREAYDSFIAPQLPIALQNCEAASSILSKALGWLRQVQLLGYDSEFQSESTKIMETMNQAIVKCYDKEYEQCVIDKNIAHRTAMLGFFRQASLLGIDDQLDFNKIKKCPPIQSYQASGQQLEMTYSGVICSLEQPFTVVSTSPVYSFDINSTPSGPQAGSFTISGTWFGVGPMDGGGTYTVNMLDTVANQLIMNASWTTHTDYMDVNGSGTMNITLTPLGDNTCGTP
jgi:hypothetical protein